MKKEKDIAAVVRGGGEETEETGSRSGGASQLAHTSPLERPREGKRGPGTGNLLLYTRPEIRMYHSRTHVGARARAHGTACRWINSHGPDREDDDGKLRTTKVDLRSTGLRLTLAHLCQRYRTVPTIGLSVVRDTHTRTKNPHCDESRDGV